MKSSLTIFETLLLFLLLVPINSILKAQDVKIEIKSLEITDNKLVIKYNFDKKIEGESFDTWIEISSQSGELISPRKISGDIGDKVIAGIDKQIIWDFIADEVILDEEINVVIKAIPTKGNIGKREVSNRQAILMSTIFPGWGLARKKSKNSYLALGVGSYVLLGSAVLLNKSAENVYNDYKTDFDIQSSEDKLKKSRIYDNLSKTTAYTGLAIWGASVIWTAVSKSKTKQNSEISRVDKPYFNIYSYQDEYSKIQGLTLSVTF